MSRLKRFRVEITEMTDTHYIVKAADEKDAETIAVADHDGPRLFRTWFDFGERDVRVNHRMRARKGDFPLAERWQPPSPDRVPMNVHASVREELRYMLTHDLMGSGVGYSEFISAALHAYERGEWSVPGVPNQIHARQP